MVPAKDCQTSQQFPAWSSSYLDRMAFLGIEKNYSLPCVCPYMPTANVGFPGHQDSAGKFLKIIPPCLKDAQCALPVEKPMDAPQKRFLIFDQSGNHTRLFVSPSFSLSRQNNISTAEMAPNATEMTARLDQQFLMKQEKWGENHLTDEEGEFFEDSEEIDALLYSDSDDDDDEVTSTLNSPIIIKEEGYGYVKNGQVMSCQAKRQRLIDGNYKEVSWMSNDTEPAISSYEDGLESSKREKKLKIGRAMKILETIVPGLSRNNDPLSIIDKAIAHLKLMKTEVECQGAGAPWE